MKKIFAALLCAAFIAITATGCGQDALYENSQAETQATEQEAEKEPEISDADFKDNLDGLHDYFVAKEYIGKDLEATKMDAQLIGAEKGNKYQVSKDLTIEIYEYAKTSTADEVSKANEVLSKVKETGKLYVVGGKDVNAYVSDNGKYLMIYSDKSINDEKPNEKAGSYILREETIKDFKAFKNK